MRRSTIIGSAALALLIGLGIYLAPLKPHILCLQFSFTEAAFHGVIAEWGPTGVALYRSHFPVDFMLLLAYGAFGSVYGREVALSNSVGGRLAALLAWALPVAAVADATENALHILLTGGWNPAIHVVYAISGVAASAKWIGMLVFAACVLAARRKRAG